MKKIWLRGELGKGRFAIVDPENYEGLKFFRWCLFKGYHTNYAKWTVGNTGVSVSMHDVVLGFPRRGYLVIDHINGNGLDNRKENLRVVSVGENNRAWRAQKNTRKNFIPTTKSYENKLKKSLTSK